MISARPAARGSYLHVSVMTLPDRQGACPAMPPRNPQDAGRMADPCHADDYGQSQEQGGLFQSAARLGEARTNDGPVPVHDTIHEDCHQNSEPEPASAACDQQRLLREPVGSSVGVRFFSTDRLDPSSWSRRRPARCQWDHCA